MLKSIFPNKKSKDAYRSANPKLIVYNNMKKLLIGLYFIFVIPIIVLVVGYSESRWSFSMWITRPIAYLAGFYLIFFMPINFLKLKYERDLKKLPLSELKNQVFRYDESYFKYIGESEPAVIQFRNLIRNQDLNGLMKEWNSLNREFVRLEKKVGHKGRPLIMDYYCWFESNLKELKRRVKKLSGAI